MNSWYHAKSAAKKWGGTAEDYIEIESFIDSSKRLIGDVRHRSMYHHTEGIFLCERIFGTTITVGGEPAENDGAGILCIPEELELSEEQEDAFTQALIESMSKPIQIVREPPPVPMIILRPRTREVPVRLIAELHIMQDLGWIPSPKDYIDNMELKTWMGGPTKTERNLSDVFPVKRESNSCDKCGWRTCICYQFNRQPFQRQPEVAYYDRPARPVICNACESGEGQHHYRCPLKTIDPPPAPLIPDPNMIIERKPGRKIK